MAELRIHEEVHSLKYADPKGRIACRRVPRQGDKVLHAGRGAPRVDTVHVEMGGGGGGGGGGGRSPELGGNMFRGQL